jgi:energy-coupling factor transporter ATP-binding protein EcfA2
MTKFRVQNYKKIRDTGWVNCGDITAFVGKNEAGKSAIFRGLSKLNPSDKEKYDGLKEFPRRKFATDFHQQDWPVASVELSLSPEETSELKGISSVLANTSSVVFTRHYSSAFDVEFVPQPKLPDVSNKSYLKSLRRWQEILEKATSPEGKGEQLGAAKSALLPFLSQKVQQIEKQGGQVTVPEGIVNEVVNTVSAHVNESWQKEVYGIVADEAAKYRDHLQIPKNLESAKQWVAKSIPRFVYFGRYDVIDSAVHIPTFIQELNQTPSAPRVRATKCLFTNVGLDPQTIAKLDPTQSRTVDELRKMADERAIRMSSASTAMTERFSKWYEQRQHKFRYQVDGPFFRVWVSDDLDPSDIELDQRSEGMQYFFSFYLVFLVEASDAHKNSILLLDEPGIHVHGTAQEKIVKFLENLSLENQLLYSTHSPFMVDGDHLENVRVVYEGDEDGATSVSQDVWPPDPDALFPLQAGLGYALAQTLFYSKYQVVVEGITDYMILKSMNEILSRRKMKSLRNDAVIVPAGGVSHLMPLVSMLRGQGMKMAVVLDGDEPGIRKGKDVETRLMVRTLFMNSFAGKEEAELEDLFPEDYYMKVVKEAYPEVTLTFDSNAKKIDCITKRVKASFAGTGKEFEKWRVARVIVDWIQKGQFPEESLGKFEQIFDKVNEILSA